MSDLGDLDGGTGAQPAPAPSPQPKPTPQSYEQRRQTMDRTRADAQRAAATPNPRAGRDAPDPNTVDGRRHIATEARRKELGVGEPAAPDAGDGDDRGGPQTAPAAPSGKIKIGDREYLEEDIHSAIAAKSAEESRALTRPQKAEDFKFGLSPNFTPPAGLDFKLDPDDPAVGMYREFAIKNGFTQEQFTEGLDLVASLRVGEAHQLSQLKKAEVTKLGAAATARVDAVTTWLNAMTGDKGAAMVRVLQMCPVADTIVAFESLIQRFTSQGGGAYSANNRRVEGGNGEIPGYDSMSFAQRRAAQDAQKGR